MRINLPNQITLMRLLLAVVFFVLLTQYRHSEPAVWILDACFVLFVIAGVSDILDGYLARKQNQITSLGRVLDPFVDKVLVCGAFVYFASGTFQTAQGENASGVAPWMVVLILGREFLVTALRGFAEARGQSYGAMFIGKVKMVVQSVTAGGLLLFVAHPQGVLGRPPMVWLKPCLIWLTVLVTAISLIQYLAKSRDVLGETARR